MLEKPVFGKFARVSKAVDSKSADVLDGFVKLFDLGRRERVGILFRVNVGIV